MSEIRPVPLALLCEALVLVWVLVSPTVSSPMRMVRSAGAWMFTSLSESTLERLADQRCLARRGLVKLHTTVLVTFSATQIEA